MCVCVYVCFLNRTQDTNEIRQQWDHSPCHNAYGPIHTTLYHMSLVCVPSKCHCVYTVAYPKQASLVWSCCSDIYVQMKGGLWGSTVNKSWKTQRKIKSEGEFWTHYLDLQDDKRIKYLQSTWEYTYWTWRHSSGQIYTPSCNNIPFSRMCHNTVWSRMWTNK